jgi:hypothetical protein
MHLSLGICRSAVSKLPLPQLVYKAEMSRGGGLDYLQRESPEEEERHHKGEENGAMVYRRAIGGGGEYGFKYFRMGFFCSLCFFFDSSFRWVFVEGFRLLLVLGF